MGQKKTAQARLSLHLSNYHLVGNHMSSVNFTNWYEYNLFAVNQSEMFFV